MIELAFALLLSTSAAQDVPAECRPGADGNVSWAACAALFQKGSPPWTFATMNQASQAYLDQDYVTAVRLYDAASGSGELLSDAYFHAFRADTYEHVGRFPEAARDARTAWRILNGEIAAPGAQDMPPLTDDQKSFILALILHILKTADDPAFPTALAAYRELPAKDWEAWGQRAAVLDQLDDTAGALVASGEALKAQPTDVGVLNNHCYILVRNGRPSEGLPYCEKAVLSAPNFAPLRHSLASALAGAGRCEESVAQLAEARRIDPATILYNQPIACTPAG